MKLKSRKTLVKMKNRIVYIYIYIFHYFNEFEINYKYKTYHSKVILRKF